MSKPTSTAGYQRAAASVLSTRLAEPRRFIQVVAGPRQVGKTTLVGQSVERLDVPVRYASADEPTLRGPGWVAEQWEAARLEAGKGDGVLVLDEVQKAANWSESVKRLWDEDTRANRRLRVVLLGSAPLLIQQGLSESLAGRFELLPVTHWTAAEMRDAFGWSPEQFIFYGAYPGCAPLIDDHDRWARYIRDSLIETTISRDVLLLTRVDKPALLRRLFELACRYSGQVLSYTKMLGQLQEAGNTTTLAHYLELLYAAGMVRGLPKYAGQVVRQRAASPKLQVLNTALISAQSGYTFSEARADRTYWGRLVESAVGAHLANTALAGIIELFYWRAADREVDFVVKSRRLLTAIEVKSGAADVQQPGLDAFASEFRVERGLLIGGNGIPVGEFLSHPVERWVAA